MTVRIITMTTMLQVINKIYRNLYLVKVDHSTMLSPLVTMIHENINDDDDSWNYYDDNDVVNADVIGSDWNQQKSFLIFGEGRQLDNAISSSNDTT